MPPFLGDWIPRMMKHRVFGGKIFGGMIAAIVGGMVKKYVGL